MNAVIENIRTRRSIRSYEQRQIPVNDLRTILEAASFAPCAMATQGWLFTALQSPEAMKKANDALRLTLRTIPVTVGMNPRMAALIEKSELDDSEFLYGAPAYVIVSHDAQNPNAMADSAIALNTMMLSAHSLGIGSCWLNHLAGFSDKPLVRALCKDLGIPDNHKIYGTLALGYSAEPPKSADPRKDVIRIL